MIPKLQVRRMNSFDALDINNQSFEHISELKLTDIATNKKFKIGLTILHMLNTTSFFEVRQTPDGDNYREEKVVDMEIIGKFASNLRIRPEVMLKTLEIVKSDKTWQNELGTCYFAIINYLDQHYKSSNIWEVPEPWKLIEGETMKELELAYGKVQEATPRAFKM